MLKVIAEGLTSSNVGLNAGSEALRVVGVARVAGVEGGAVGRGDGLGNAPAVPFCGVVPGFEAAPMTGGLFAIDVGVRGLPEPAFGA